jgi:hypothetical protein
MKPVTVFISLNMVHSYRFKKVQISLYEILTMFYRVTVKQYVDLFKSGPVIFQYNISSPIYEI